jgi:hypothetical protein
MSITKSFKAAAVLRRHCAKLKPCDNNLPEYFEEKEIHQFPLRVKKLKAFFAF